MAGTSPAASNLTCDSSASVAAMGLGVGTAGSLEVEPRRPFDPLGRNGVDIALAQDEVVLTANLYLVAIFGIEQHPVPRLGAAYVVADGHHLGPRQALGDLGGSRDQNAAGGLSLTVLPRDLHQQAIVEHFDGKLVGVGQSHGPNGTGQIVRTVMPAISISALASATVCSPKWKMDAASTASAPPSTTPSTRCCRVPTPPE